MGDRALDEYGLPDDDALARREALMERLRSPPQEAGAPKAKKRLSISQDDLAPSKKKKNISISNPYTGKLPTVVGASSKANDKSKISDASAAQTPEPERSPSILEIDSKAFLLSQGRNENSPQRNPSPTPPRRHIQGAKVFVMKRNASHMQRACSDVGDHFDIPGLKTGTVRMRADLIEEWINARNLGNDPFLVPDGRMVDSNICT
ncbi:uncharacterized protein EAE97_011187 [Botrytis byssoidea]|uniref:Uncharacterized protein n=1 Tax=Botrytis byssoidea TaxID=139641 RepID=A0A9P5HSV1_9HELO|nr:uncharacterized protein EAE97_011187 [Botrytis byssoidea]KAF7921896.1 hypothetical protein EAE97_011187 [Botrytis byssoidea]